MRTIQIRITQEQMNGIDSLVNKGIYPSRSEAIRDSVRKLLDSERQSYFDHHKNSQNNDSRTPDI